MVRDDFIVREHPGSFPPCNTSPEPYAPSFALPRAPHPLLKQNNASLQALSRTFPCSPFTALCQREASISSNEGLGALFWPIRSRLSPLWVGPISTYNWTARWFLYGVRFPRSVEVRTAGSADSGLGRLRRLANPF